VLEARVKGARIDQARQGKLANSSQPLKDGRIDQLLLDVAACDKPVDRVP
jgi:hypothetical protein